MSPNLRLASLVLGTCLVAAGCSDMSTPTEVPLYKYTPGPTPVPPKSWKGTFTGASIACNSSASVLYDTGEPLPTQADVGCLNGGVRILLSLTRQGNTLTGYALWGDPEFYPITGTVTESAMDFTIFNDTVDFPNGPTGPMGKVHLQP